MTDEQIRSMWDYMGYGSANVKLMEDKVYDAQSRVSLLDSDKKDDKELLDDADALWGDIHSGKVRFNLFSRFKRFPYRTLELCS